MSQKEDFKCGENKIAVDVIIEKEKKMMEQNGFYMHVVFDNDSDFVDAHTHGFEDTLNHPDFQIVYPLHHNTIGGIFHTIFKEIKEGNTISTNQLVYNIVEKYPVKFTKVRDTTLNRELFRVIFPDKNGLFPGESKHELVRDQPFFRGFDDEYIIIKE